MSYEQYQNQFQTLTIQRKYKLALALIDEYIANGLEPQQIMTDIVAKTLQSLQSFDESPRGIGLFFIDLIGHCKDL